jgi:hypothetical protein
MCAYHVGVHENVSLCNYRGVKRVETACSLITALVHSTRINIVAMHYTMYTETSVFGFPYGTAAFAATMLLFAFVNGTPFKYINTSLR